MAERRDHIARHGAGSNPACPAYIRIRPGRVSLPLSRRLRGSQPCGCTSPEAGNDLLSSFLSPAEAGHMVGVAQRQSGGLQNRMSRVRIPPRPPRRIRCAGCQKWESPNLSKADSRQRPPAGPPAVIWDSGVWSLIRVLTLETVGSIPACPTTLQRGRNMDIRKIAPRRESCYLCGAPLPKGRRKYCFKCRPSRARGSPAGSKSGNQ